MLSIRWRRSMTQWLLTKWLKVATLVRRLCAGYLAKQDKCFYTLQLSANSDALSSAAFENKRSGVHALQTRCLTTQTSESRKTCVCLSSTHPSTM